MIGPLRGEIEPPQPLRKEKNIEGNNLQKKREPLRSRGGGILTLEVRPLKKDIAPCPPPQKKRVHQF